MTDPVTALSDPVLRQLLLAGFCGLLLLILAVLGLRQRRLNKEVRHLNQHLQVMRQQLDTLQARLTETEQETDAARPAPPSPDFGATLQSVEQRGLVYRGGGGTPERYRYVAALAEQGMDATQIARALHIAPAEAEQAIRLAAIAHKPAEKAAEP